MLKKKVNIIFLTLSIVISLLIHPILLLPILYYWIKEYYNYKIYNYDTSKDYQYHFNTEPTIINLENNQFNLPSYIDNTYTVMVQIKIKSNFYSKLIMPNISISNKTKTIKQFFEYYAQGVRYLNVSSLIDDTKIIKLDANYLNITNNKLLVYITKNIPLTNKTILFLSTHPDDAEIAGYGLYSKYNKNTHIVNISAGDSGTYITNNDKISKEEAEKHKGKLRLIDSLTTPLFAGITQQNIYNLGYKDSKLKELYSNPVKHPNFKYYRNFNINKLKNHEHNWNSLIADLSEIIENVQPDVILTPHPQIDSNYDHQYTTIALNEALDNINYNDNTPILLYSNHLTNTEAYPFGEKYSIVSLPPSFYNDSFYFESIYTQNLSDFTQVEKYYALESIHDVRTIDVNTTFLSALKFEFRKAKKKLLGNHFYYYRKAVRDNELFFVVNKSNLHKMI